MNRAQVRNILRPAGLQTKLTIGRKNDRYEQEADAVAEKVEAGVPAPKISTIAPGSLKGIEAASGLENRPLQKDEKEKEEEEQRGEQTVQRQSEEEEEEELVQPFFLQRQADKKEEEEEEIQSFFLQRQAEEEEEEELQAAGGVTQSPAMADNVSKAIRNKGGGSPVKPATRQRLEASIGTDFSRVRVHDDAAGREAADGLNARAFTYGNDIWLGKGASQDNIPLMAHEAAHVVQQGNGVQRLIQRAESAAQTGSEGEAATTETVDPATLPPYGGT